MIFNLIFFRIIGLNIIVGKNLKSWELPTEADFKPFTALSEADRCDLTNLKVHRFSTVMHFQQFKVQFKFRTNKNLPEVCHGIMPNFRIQRLKGKLWKMCI